MLTKEDLHVGSLIHAKIPHIKNCITRLVSGLRLTSRVEIKFLNIIMILQMKMEQDFFSLLFSGPVLFGQDREHAVQQHWGN